jgi:hypothetical protein
MLTSLPMSQRFRRSELYIEIAAEHCASPEARKALVRELRRTRERHKRAGFKAAATLQRERRMEARR